MSLIRVNEFNNRHLKVYLLNNLFSAWQSINYNMHNTTYRADFTVGTTMHQYDTIIAYLDKFNLLRSDDNFHYIDAK